MTEVKAYECNNILYKEQVEGSVEVLAYAADGRLFLTKEEAEMVDASWDLKHIVKRMSLPELYTEEVISFIKQNRKELLNILIRV